MSQDVPSIRTQLLTTDTIPPPIFQNGRILFLSSHQGHHGSEVFQHLLSTTYLIEIAVVCFFFISIELNKA